MKPLKTAVCAIALMLGCVPLAACGSRPNDSANKEGEETEIGEVVTLPGQIEIPEVPEEPQEPQPAKTEYILVSTNGLNVRSGAGTSYASLGTVEKGVLLHYAGTAGGWYETRYKGRTAFVSADARYTSLASMEAGSETVERVIQEGLNVLGTPYVYGAVRLHDGKGNLLKNFTSAEFDCSSLMQYMFYRGANVNLNMTTRTQVSQGKEVAKKDIQRGDLLFFTNASRKDNTGIKRIGHVALYLGDNYILHTASDYAKIEQISTTRWSYYITARRVL